MRALLGATAPALLAFPAPAQRPLPPIDAPVVQFSDLSQVVSTLDLDADGDRDALSWWGITDQGAMHHQYGQGSPGLGGVAPVFGANGPFRSGNIATRACAAHREARRAPSCGV
ncbi:MAG: hypothetical protein AAF628_23020 [Planctomycetota bacterium]